jgi:predicted metalloenzyme YecM
MCCSDRRSISVLEIPSPKEGSPYPRGLEHVEFAIGLENSDASPITPINDATHQYRLQTLMEEHPEIKSWNVKAKRKKINPDVSLKIELPTFGNCSVKFHLLPLESVIEYESAHEMA